MADRGSEIDSELYQISASFVRICNCSTGLFSKICLDLWPSSLAVPPLRGSQGSFNNVMAVWYITSDQPVGAAYFHPAPILIKIQDTSKSAQILFSLHTENLTRRRVSLVLK